MTRARRERIGRTLGSVAMLLLACTLVAPAAQAQQQQELTEDLVDIRLAAVRAAGTLDEPLEAIYEEARAFLAQANANEQAEESYVRSLTSAPAQQELIQARLDRIGDTYDPAGELVGLTPEDLGARLALARTQLSELASQLESTDRSLDAREASTASLEARLTEVDQLTSALPATIPNIDFGGQPSAQEAEQFRTLAEARSLAAERPLDFMARLAALVPKPRVNLTRFHGVFAPNSKHRALVTPAKRGKGNKARVPDEPPTPAECRASMTWAQRLKRVFSIDIETCSECGGSAKVIACIEDPVVIQK